MSTRRRYGVALASFALAFALTRLLWPIKEEGVFILFLGAVMLSAYHGGVGPGALTAALSAVAANFVFLPPVYSLAVLDLSTALRVSEFLLVSALVIALNDARLRAQRRAEAARAEVEAASRAKDDFLAMVSHELRAPLSAILGWAQIARAEGHQAETWGRALDVIERNAAAQQRLIDDLLDMARMTSGTLGIEARPVVLREVVWSSVESARPAAEAKGVQLETVLGAEGARVSGDAGRLAQVVTNLLANAVKFTPRGGSVTLRLDASDSETRVVVCDTGCGIEAEFLPHVFERFRQSNGTGKLSRSGLGLGLAIVRHVIELHGGTVSAESEGEGRGATFTVRLPLAAPVESDAGREAAARSVWPAVG